MSALLARMDASSYVLELESPLESVPHIEGFTLERVDATTLLADVPSARGIHVLFDGLAQQGIRIHGLRNASNRLEQLFLDMLEAE